MDNDEILALVFARQEIEQVISRYCRAVDRLDVELLKSVYHEDAVDDHGSFRGNAHEFAEFIVDNIRKTTVYGFHTVTSSTIDVRGDVAAAESYYIAYSRHAGGWEQVSEQFGERYATAAREAGTLDQEHEYVAGGRYIDRFERRAGEWRIARRQLTNEWNQCGPTTNIYDEGRVAAYKLPGSRDRTDPVYANLLPE